MVRGFAADGACGVGGYGGDAAQLSTGNSETLSRAGTAMDAVAKETCPIICTILQHLGSEAFGGPWTCFRTG